MKKSQTIQLTLAAGAVALVAACSDGRPEQTVQCYQDPNDPSVCVEERRAGYLPIFYPMFFGGRYYNQSGRVATAPPVGSREYQIARSRSVNTSFDRTGAPVTARGGFGSTGSGRSAVS